MKYFPQRNLTDCLLACLECFLQTSREEFYKDLLEFVELKDINGAANKYLRYVSVGNLMSWYGYFPGIRMWDKHSYVELGKTPKILGIPYHNQPALHSVFWDGEKIYEPWSEEFYSGHSYHKIAYSIGVIENNLNYGSYAAVPWLYLFDKNGQKSGEVLPEKFDHSNIKYMYPIICNEKIE